MVDDFSAEPRSETFWCAIRRTIKAAMQIYASVGIIMRPGTRTTFGKQIASPR